MTRTTTTSTTNMTHFKIQRETKQKPKQIGNFWNFGLTITICHRMKRFTVARWTMGEWEGERGREEMWDIDHETKFTRIERKKGEAGKKRLWIARKFVNYHFTNVSGVESASVLYHFSSSRNGFCLHTKWREWKWKSQFQTVQAQAVIINWLAVLTSAFIPPFNWVCVATRYLLCDGICGMCSRYDVLVLDDIVNSHHHRRADVKSTQTHQLGKKERKKDKRKQTRDTF